MIQFSSDSEMQKIPKLTEDFLEHVLYDEEPLFISDEATIWDVSMSSVEELTERVSRYYGILTSAADLKQPLGKLIRQLSEGSDRRELTRLAREEIKHDAIPGCADRFAKV